MSRVPAPRWSSRVLLGLEDRGAQALIGQQVRRVVFEPGHVFSAALAVGGVIPEALREPQEQRQVVLAGVAVADGDGAIDERQRYAVVAKPHVSRG